VVGGTISLPSGALLTVQADGSFSYQPVAGFVGQDAFTVTVSDGAETAMATVTIDVTNDPPVVGEVNYVVHQGQKHIIDPTGLLSSASNGDGDSMAVSAINGNTAVVGATISLPSGALLTVQADGGFSYQPLAGFVGQDAFTVTVSDGAEMAMATVTIDVT